MLSPPSTSFCKLCSIELVFGLLLGSRVFFVENWILFFLVRLTMIHRFVWDVCRTNWSRTLALSWILCIVLDRLLKPFYVERCLEVFSLWDHIRKKCSFCVFFRLNGSFLKLLLLALFFWRLLCGYFMVLIKCSLLFLLLVFF